MIRFSRARAGRERAGWRRLAGYVSFPALALAASAGPAHCSSDANTNPEWLAAAWLWSATRTCGVAEVPAAAPAGVVTTFAGSAGNLGGADGSGTSARFYFPIRVATDGSTLFVTDFGSNLVRRVDPQSAQVSTLAGSFGQAGSTDATGSAARFLRPYGIAVDSTHVYVTDQGNHTIRRIAKSTGLTETLAGEAGQSGATDGVGSAARFLFPRDVAASGDFLYVADSDNHTLRRVRKSDGNTVTISGRAGERGYRDGPVAQALYSDPYGVSVGGDSLFIADLSNHLIRCQSFLTGQVTTLAGRPQQPGAADGVGGSASFDKPIRAAHASGRLFLADFSRNTIRTVELSSGRVSTLAGTPGSGGTADGSGAAAAFYEPSGLVAQGTSVFVADTGNHTIRRID